MIGFKFFLCFFNDGFKKDDFVWIFVDGINVKDLIDSKFTTNNGLSSGIFLFLKVKILLSSRLDTSIITDRFISSG
jgi:hypothetical protein